MVRPGYIKGYIKKSYMREIKAVVLVGVAFFVSCALYSYNMQDFSLVHYSTQVADGTYNWCGIVGAQCAAILFYLLGAAAYLLPLFLVVSAYRYMKNSQGSDNYKGGAKHKGGGKQGNVKYNGNVNKGSIAHEWDRLLAGIGLIVVAAGICCAYQINGVYDGVNFNDGLGLDDGLGGYGGLSGGGLVGMQFMRLLYSFFDYVGGMVCLYVLLYSCLIIVTRFSFMGAVGVVTRKAWKICCFVYESRMVQSVMCLGARWLFVVCNKVYCVIRKVLESFALDETVLTTPDGVGHDIKNSRDTSLFGGAQSSKVSIGVPVSAESMVYAGAVNKVDKKEQVGEFFASQKELPTQGATEASAIFSGLSRASGLSADQSIASELSSAGAQLIEQSMTTGLSHEAGAFTELSKLTSTTMLPAEQSVVTGLSQGAVGSGDQSASVGLSSESSVAVPSAEQSVSAELPKYILPDVSLFAKRAHRESDSVLIQECEARAQLLQEKLARFGIKGIVVAIKHGPVVTLFEYQPDIDAKLSKIVALEDDLAMALKALSIRIIAPIPGRAVVGFEIANAQRQDVLLADIIHSSEYKKYKAALPLILGQDPVGKGVIVDLARMPHLLIAGSTGSGKSVGLNAMLISLLCARTPDELKIILIDPKRLEFTAYADIAHLLFPIITDTKAAVPILKWVAMQMDARYTQMAASGVRNIIEYNSQSDQGASWERMPFIVVIIDELADLMITVGREVEDAIARITQMARAAGIHLIVATQRPSVDVITGLIKVNFPSRISFRVTSRVDSRTILDCGGADKLLGRGDMLFLDSTGSTLNRVHGAYVSDAEIAQITAHIRAERPVNYLDITAELQKDERVLDEKDDMLYEHVLHYLDEIESISISSLQRKFKIGYNRSARIIDQLASSGRIMQADGSKTRRVIK